MAQKDVYICTYIHISTNIYIHSVIYLCFPHTYEFSSFILINNFEVCVTLDSRNSWFNFNDPRLFH